MKKVGLRIDVDTWRGTRDGVPRLLEMLDNHHRRASFFFSVGPDNMGRHLWRLIKPKFLWKMLRSRAPSLYGWDILLAGTAWPGRKIGEGFSSLIQTSAERHEVGLHAWDHFAWQTWAGTWNQFRLKKEIQLGIEALNKILPHPVTCSAAPGWRSDQSIVEAKEDFHFRYNSDCRGHFPFRARLRNGEIGTIQIPVTLPTWDEAVGSQTAKESYNRFILDKIHSDSGVPVYTIHAEVEGIIMHKQFNELLTLAESEGINFCPLSELLPDDISTLPMGKIKRGKSSGREGWVGCQETFRY